MSNDNHIHELINKENKQFLKEQQEQEVYNYQALSKANFIRSNRAKLSTDDVKLILFLINKIKPFKYLGDNSYSQTKKWDLIQRDFAAIRKDLLNIPTVRTLQRQLATALKKATARRDHRRSLGIHTDNLITTLSLDSSIEELESAILDLNDASEKLRNNKIPFHNYNSYSEPLQVLVVNSNSTTKLLFNKLRVLKTDLTSESSNQDRTEFDDVEQNDILDRDLEDRNLQRHIDTHLRGNSRLQESDLDQSLERTIDGDLDRNIDNDLDHNLENSLKHNLDHNLERLVSVEPQIESSRGLTISKTIQNLESILTQSIEYQSSISLENFNLIETTEALINRQQDHIKKLLQYNKDLQLKHNQINKDLVSSVIDQLIKLESENGNDNNDNDVEKRLREFRDAI